MKKFVGLLSIEDAELLERYASRARTILEFGAGGSTHIFAQSIPKGGIVTTFDTKASWLDLTATRLQKLGVRRNVVLRPYAEWSTVKDQLGQHDLVFVDGEWPFRRAFALEAWPLLRVGGHMLFHDTRRTKDIALVTAVIATHFLEVERVDANEKHAGRTSNITAIQKKAREPEVNWYKREGKPPWAYGLSNVPESFWSKTAKTA